MEFDIVHVRVSHGGDRGQSTQATHKEESVELVQDLVACANECLARGPTASRRTSPMTLDVDAARGLLAAAAPSRL